MRVGETWNDRYRKHWEQSSAPAVVTAEGTWSGRELTGRAGGAAAWLDRCGYPVGRPIPAVLDESPTAIALSLGATLSGRPLAPLGTKLPAADLAAAVAGLGAQGMVTTADLADRAGAVADLVDVSVHVLDGLPGEGPAPSYVADPDDVAFIVHTSGTTGAPKAIPARQRSMVARCDLYGSVVPMGAGDRYCSASPFHHTAGISMVYTALGRGCALVPQAWFSVEGWQLAGELGVTVALLVPTMIEMLLSAGALGDAEPDHLQYGAAPIHPATLTAALAALPRTRFVQIFGQTEMSPFTHLPHEDHVRALAGRPDLLSTVGRPVPGVEVRLDHQDEDGVGELVFRGPHAFAVDDDGWRRSGDLGTVDGDGYIRILNRKDDKIIRGGENIYPTEVEAALLEHPGVREVAVVGVPDRRLGEIVLAAVVATDPARPPEVDDLVAHARERIAHFKVPEMIQFVPELPRTVSGKVMRRALVS